MISSKPNFGLNRYEKATVFQEKGTLPICLKGTESERRPISARVERGPMVKCGRRERVVTLRK